MADQMMNQPLTDMNQMEPDIINVDPKLPEDPNALFRG
jgi:hypothetical protein